MKNLRFPLAAALVAAALAPALSFAQVGNPFDHLKCYKIKDSQPKAPYKADLVPLQRPPFNVEPGCVISVPAQLFCIPVQKINVQPSPPFSVNGINAQDYLLYKIRCPKVAGTVVSKGGLPVDVKDQFGARTIFVGTHQVLLVPAFKQSHLCSNQSNAGGQVCGGDCEDPNQKCVLTPGTTQCACESKCGVDAAGVCGGTCPFNTQICQVRPDATGVLVCTCDPFVDGCSRTQATGQCGGPCPNADETCVNASGTCKCEKPCGPTGIHMCGGLCPTTTETCVVKPDDSGCECRPTTQQPCGPDPLTNQCGGVCPNNLPCVVGGPVPGPGCICG